MSLAEYIAIGFLILLFCSMFTGCIMQDRADKRSADNWDNSKALLYQMLKQMQNGTGQAVCITITGYGTFYSGYHPYSAPAWNETHIVRPSQPEDLPKLVKQINAVYPQATVTIAVLPSS
jgi:hypothetical protein